MSACLILKLSRPDIGLGDHRGRCPGVPYRGLGAWAGSAVLSSLGLVCDCAAEFGREFCVKLS